jgi:hypothetical protein
MNPRLLVCLALVAAPAFAAEPLRCPPGAQVKTEVLPPRHADWCEDPKTSKRNGPARVLNANDEVLVEVEYLQGEPIARHVTGAGLKHVLAELNLDFTRQGTPYVLSLIDEHTLRFDITIDGVQPGAVEKNFRAQMLAQSPICSLFGIEGTDFRSLQLNATNEKKQALASETFTRADCQPPGKK